MIPSRFMAQDYSSPNVPDKGLKIVSAADPADKNNNFYDNADTYALPGGEIMVEGEIENPGFVDFSALRKHSLIIKEALIGPDGKNQFTGAYRYDGYSLFDILSSRILKKRNKDEFASVIDLYVIIENARGEKVVLNWGEIYYPNNLHKCLIATEVARIVPSKSGELWPLPAERKLVVSNDLLGDYLKFSHENLQGTMLTIIGIDGYRAVFSLSEVMNRNDQEEVLLVPCIGNEDGGRYRLFPACDFFSDRAIKAVSEISISRGE